MAYKFEETQIRTELEKLKGFLGKHKLDFKDYTKAAKSYMTKKNFPLV